MFSVQLNYSPVAVRLTRPVRKSAKREHLVAGCRLCHPANNVRRLSVCVDLTEWHRYYVNQ